MFAGLYIFRNVNTKRKNERLIQDQKEQAWRLKELASENRQVELQKQSAELEMQALRAQMNPHFIFNSLSSINHFIVKNESKTASSYLTRFSRLIRMVLMNSQRKLIPIEDELEMLRLYLDMERLRFKNAFDYSITTTNAVESGPMFIPPLLLQPFCENAIWHGLMNKEGQGHLNISISEQNSVMSCIIIDDGVGREKAAILRSKSVEKEKSMGLQITAKRLSLLNDENSSDTFFEIEDLWDQDGNAAGTKVILNIHCKESMEEIL
jgi:sensor histidine kinase YesM